MEDRYLLSDFWIYSADGNVRAHYQHFDNDLTVPDTYVCTTFIKHIDGTRNVMSQLITKNTYINALDYALNH